MFMISYLPLSMKLLSFWLHGCLAPEVWLLLDHNRRVFPQSLPQLQLRNYYFHSIIAFSFKAESPVSR